MCKYRSLVDKFLLKFYIFYMELVNLIEKIKKHQDFSFDEMENAINQYTHDEITDQEFLPLIDAIYHNGLSDKCLYFLTKAMKNSGAILDLSPLGNTVDKHSTGGVSDTTTIVIVPVLACLGTKMLKLSGRSLGFTGGTCDKLECFEGYKTDISLDKAFELVKKNGGCMMTSTASLAPADKKIYALRDKTNLVDNISLIASSVMSKKLATGADVIVLDVKYGNGAFMPNKKSAASLGKKMVMLAKLDGKKAKVVYGDMSQPLGYNIGTLLECMEAVDVLKHYNKKSPLTKACVHLASVCHSLDKHIPYLIAKKRVIKVMKNGKALEKLKTMVASQGGTLDLFEKPYPAPQKVVYAQKDCVVKGFKTKTLGEIVNNLNHKYQTTKYGIITYNKIGEKIKKGEKLFSLYAPQEDMDDISKQILDCFEF